MKPDSPKPVRRLAVFLPAALRAPGPALAGGESGPVRFA